MTNDIILKALIMMPPLERELYILQVIINEIETDIIHNGFILPDNNNFKKLMNSADDTLEQLIKSYKHEELLSFKRKTNQIQYLFKIKHYSIEDYVSDFITTKNRLLLHNDNLIYKPPTIRSPWKQFIKFIRNLFSKGNE